MTDPSSPKPSRHEQLLDIMSRIQSDPEFTRGATENLDAALERAGLTEAVAALSQEPETVEADCQTTCRKQTCTWTCAWTNSVEM